MRSSVKSAASACPPPYRCRRGPLKDVDAERDARWQRERWRFGARWRSAPPKALRSSLDRRGRAAAVALDAVAVALGTATMLDAAALALGATAAASARRCVGGARRSVGVTTHASEGGAICEGLRRRGLLRRWR